MSLIQYINQKRKVADLPHTLELHKDLWRDWMYEYSVEDFLKGGKIYQAPENYGDPQWASHIASFHYGVYPVTVERIKYYLQGHMYLRDGEDGTIEIQYYKPVEDSDQKEEDVETD